MIDKSANHPLAVSVVTPLNRRPLAMAISSLLLSGALAGTVQAQVFPAVVTLNDLDGNSGFRLDGVAEYDYSGLSVSGAGDINGDGIDDLIIGALGADFNGNASGSSYVVFGRDVSAGGDFPATLSLSTLNGSTGFRLDGEAPGDYAGISVSAAGDINGDGIDDLIIGASGADINGSASGSSYVVFGRDVSTVGDFPATLNLSTLNGSTGFRLDGVAAGDRSGYSVSAAGDINGDGIDDLIIGAFFADPNGDASGSSYVVFGRDVSTVGDFPATLNLSTLDGSTGFRLDGEAQDDYSGRSVSAAGDINGDGVDDLIIGAYGASPPGGSNYAGSSYVVFGRNVSAVGNFPASLALSSLNGSNGFRLDGEASSDYSGISVSAAGDINGDGIGDLIIGAAEADPDGKTRAGSGYLVFGRDVSVLGNFPATLALSSLDGTNGFRLDGEAAGDRAGISVSAAGDINGDGMDDLIIGAYGVNNFAGSSYVMFGSVGPFPATLALSSLDGSNGFRLDGLADSDLSGFSVSAAGDINGDGVDDLVIGAHQADPAGSSSGSSYVVFGGGINDVIFADRFEAD
jgi:hypothetical protein